MPPVKWHKMEKSNGERKQSMLCPHLPGTKRLATTGVLISTARSTRYGFDRARWRGLWRVAIQEYVVCALQNIMTLVRFVQRPVKGLCTLPIPIQDRVYTLIQRVLLAPARFITLTEWYPQSYRYVVR